MCPSLVSPNGYIARGGSTIPHQEFAAGAMCACVSLCHKCVYSCNRCLSQDAEPACHYKDSLSLPLHNPSHHLCPTVLNLWQPLSSFHYNSFIISRMLYRWNHIVCDLLSLAFFFTLSICPWHRFKGCRYQHFASSCCWAYPRVTVLRLSVHLLRDILVVLSFWILHINWLKAIMCRFLCWHKFSFLWNKCPEVHFVWRMASVSSC